MVIKGMMGTYFTICPKVSLSNIFYVLKPDENMSFYNKINRKHVDFLICDTETMKPRFAIELDDKSHNRQNRVDQDEFVEELFDTAGLPLVRLPVRPGYNTSELGTYFRIALSKSQVKSAPSAEPARAAAPTGAGVEALSQPSTGSDNGEQPAPICPKCGVPMILRTSQQRATKGKQFWGCVNYPMCKVVCSI